MKKQYSALLVLAALAGFIAGACKKDKDPVTAPSEISRSIKLKAHSWKHNSYFYLLKGTTYTPYLMPGCVADDKLDYHSNGRYIKDAGATLCPGQKQYDTMNWELLNGGLQLKLSNSSLSIVKEIVSFEDDSLVLLEVAPNGDSFVYMYMKY